MSFQGPHVLVGVLYVQDLLSPGVRILWLEVGHGGVCKGVLSTNACVLPTPVMMPETGNPKTSEFLLQT